MGIEMEMETGMETGTINTHTDSTTTMIAAERRGGAGGAGGGGGGAERVARSHANPDPDPDPHPGHSNPNPAAATTTTTTTSYVANPLSSSVPSPFLSSSSSAAAAAAASSPAAASGSSTSFVVSSPDPFTSRYTWNSYLAEEFHALAGESTWCVPVMHGSVQRRTLSLYGRDVTVTLGTNSSTHQHINISTNPNQ